MALTNVAMEPKQDVFIVHAFDDRGEGCAKKLSEILSLINITTAMGRDLGGKPVSVEVRQRLKRAAVVVAVLTPDPENADRPSPWTLQEVAITIDNNIPCILVVEEGLVFSPGIAGDLEQIRFPPGDFGSVEVRVARQVDALVRLSTHIPDNPPDMSLDYRVRLLILDAREYGKKRLWPDVARVSDEALNLNPKTTSAAINKGVALVNMGHLVSAERFFQRILDEFDNADDSQLSKVHQNLAWVEGVRDAWGLNPKSLRKRVRHLEKSLALDPQNMHARASLLLCRVALEEHDEAHALLMESLNGGIKFIKALHQVVGTMGAIGHRLLGRLPNWLYLLVFPIWRDGDDSGPLAA
jgi:hypothetical protein